MLIGLLGRSRVGKDTAASVIVDALGGDANVRIMRLSQPLKDAVQALYGFSREQVEDEQKEVVDDRYNVTPRVCIQRLCDHIMSMHGKDFFSKQLYTAYDRGCGGNTQHIVIPDIRYEHDIHEIRRRGGVVIKIERPPCDALPRHIWESHIDALSGDVTVVNDSDIHIFREAVSRIVYDSVLASPCSESSHRPPAED